MTITLNSDYDVTLSTALLGYVGETNARPVSVEGLTVDGADRYVLTIDYGDGVQYEVDITGGQWTPTADILRSAQTISCQIAAKKLSGQEYILVKKSRIFRLRIGAAIGDNAVPSPSVAADALDRIAAIGEQVEADVARAENAASTAMQAAENAKKSATNAGLSADTAEQAAERAETAQASAETSATQADTAMQGAENARAEAVTAQNAAKISAAQASASAQQTEADKTITAGYAKTAKNCADSTVADRRTQICRQPSPPQKQRQQRQRTPLNLPQLQRNPPIRQRRRQAELRPHRHLQKRPLRRLKRLDRAQKLPHRQLWKMQTPLIS